MSESVVITGVGTVSPVGCTRDAVVAGIRACKSALVHQDFGEGIDLAFANVTPDSEEACASALDFLDAHEQELVDADLSIRYCVYAAAQALAEARLDPAVYDPWRVAMVVSGSKGQFRSLMRARRLMVEVGLPNLSAQQRADFGKLWENYPGDTAGRYVARRYAAGGPVLSYPAACATGVYSVVSGMHLLMDGRADMVIAGASESTRNPIALAGFRNMGAISSDICRPFDRRRDGFSPGEGAGIFVLERESDARARNAPIRWRIAGWDIRSDCYHITGVDETGQVAEYSLRKCLNRAEWDPATIDYFNAHGTGTPQNDGAEAGVVRRVCGQPGPYISSLKATVGHCLGASASVELAVAAMALEDDYIPPTLHCDEPDPVVDGLRVVRDQGIEMPIKRWVKSTLGFGGHIGMLAMERA